MGRSGMGPQGFQLLAQLMREAVIDDRQVQEALSRLRQQYLELTYCFRGDAFEEKMNKLMET